MPYVYLAFAILVEVAASISLGVGTSGRRPFYFAAAAGYTGAFLLLLAALREGLPLGIAYGIWVAFGVVLTAFASRRLFKDPLTARMLGGISIIVVGVLLVEIGAAH